MRPSTRGPTGRLLKIEGGLEGREKFPSSRPRPRTSPCSRSPSSPALLATLGGTLFRDGVKPALLGEPIEILLVLLSRLGKARLKTLFVQLRLPAILLGSGGFETILQALLLETLSLEAVPPAGGSVRGSKLRASFCPSAICSPGILFSNSVAVSFASLLPWPAARSIHL